MGRLSKFKQHKSLFCQIALIPAKVIAMRWFFYCCTLEQARDLDLQHAYNV